MKVIKTVPLGISSFVFSRLFIPVLLLSYYALATALFAVSRVRRRVRAHIGDAINTARNVAAHTRKEQTYISPAAKLRKFLP